MLFYSFDSAFCVVCPGWIERKVDVTLELVLFLVVVEDRLKTSFCHSGSLVYSSEIFPSSVSELHN
jgi:hypothetical protein